MSWLDLYFIGITTIQNNGGAVPQRPILDIIGATVADDAIGNRTKVTVAGFPTTPVLVTTSGPVTAQNNYEYYVDLNAAGGNVTFTTSALSANQGFGVYLINATGGHSCTISPISAGSHIDAVYPPSGPSAPGTLTTSLVMSVVGSGISLLTPDGVNLWSQPS